VYNTQNEHVDIYTNYSKKLKFSPITPNWYGETQVMVQAIDSGKKKSYSNEFTVSVLPVNDEPTTKHPLPDVQLIEGVSDYKLDLNLKEYFTDIEEDYLYYSIELDPRGLLDSYQKQVTTLMDEYNIVHIQSIGDFNTFHNGTNIPIPLWVYCDDDKEVNTLANGEGNFTRQEILITVLPVNDPPYWLKLPKIYLNEDDTESFTSCINLFKYLRDDETDETELIIDVIGNSNPNIDVLIKKGQLTVITPEHYYGSTKLMLRASETDPDFKDDTTLEIKVKPVNDAPEIDITSHIDYADAERTEKLSGSVFDVEDTVQLVEIKIDSHELDLAEGVHYDWQQAEINYEYYNWTYKWDTTTVPDGDYKITARVYDGELTSETMINLQVDNGVNAEPVVDIITPVENEMVNGSVLIKGTVYDPDNQGIEELKIRVGQEMDWTEIELEKKNGTIDWFFLWDSSKVYDGYMVISAKAHDGISWSAPMNRLILINNGINDTATDSSKSTKGTEGENVYWLIIVGLIALIIVIGLLVMAFIVNRGKKQIKEIIPDGRIEPLEEVEAKLKMELGPAPGTTPHAALPAAPTAAATIPGLPPATTSTVRIAQPLSLPSAEPSGAALPALPPAIAKPAEPSTGDLGSSYDLYKLEATDTQPVSLTSAGGYQPPQPQHAQPAQQPPPAAAATPATAITTAAPATPSTENKTKDETEQD
jgi:hypothetical protein